MLGFERQPGMKFVLVYSKMGKIRKCKFIYINLDLLTLKDSLLFILRFFSYSPTGLQNYLANEI